MDEFSTLFLLNSLTELLRVEDACRQHGLPAQIEPVPPSLRSGCMMCLACRDRDAPRICQLLDMWRYTYTSVPRHG